MDDAATSVSVLLVLTVTGTVRETTRVNPLLSLLFPWWDETLSQHKCGLCCDHWPGITDEWTWNIGGIVG